MQRVELIGWTCPNIMVANSVFFWTVKVERHMPRFDPENHQIYMTIESMSKKKARMLLCKASPVQRETLNGVVYAEAIFEFSFIQFCQHTCPRVVEQGCFF